MPDDKVLLQVARLGIETLIEKYRDTKGQFSFSIVPDSGILMKSLDGLRTEARETHRIELVCEVEQKTVSH